jgi:NADH:ubiquinone oxidoreductase subunit K
VAASEVAVGLAIILAIYRGLADIDTNNINLLKW